MGLLGGRYSPEVMAFAARTTGKPLAGGGGQIVSGGPSNAMPWQGNTVPWQASAAPSSFDGQAADVLQAIERQAVARQAQQALGLDLSGKVAPDLFGGKGNADPMFREKVSPTWDDFSGGSGLSNGFMGKVAPQWGSMSQGPPAFGQTPQSAPGGMASLGGDWANVDRWNREIAAASAKYGVPANLIKAVMQLESGGQNLGPNGAGAQGPMQVVGRFWNSLGYNLSDPAQNIMAGAAILNQFKNQYAGWAQQNGVDPWKAALYSYYAGNPYNLNARDDPAQGGSGMTTADYGSRIWNTFQQLNGRGGPASAPQTGAPSGGGRGIEIVTGGKAPITQEYGMTDWARGGGAWMYGYTSAYSRNGQVIGHAGLDIGGPLGGALYSPVNGTVVTAGGTNYYTDEQVGKGVRGSGELRIQLDNGDQVVLGHNRAINVQVGQRVTAGQQVATIGTYNGPHVHLEYLRKAPGLTSSGYEAVDPRIALGGAMASPTGGGGFTGQAPTQGGGMQRGFGGDIRSQLMARGKWG